MKKFILVILVVILFLSNSANAAEASKMIKLAADEWCPYNCEPKTPFPGYMVEIMQHVFEPLGYKVEYVKMPWVEALKQAKSGKVDGVIAGAASDVPDLISPEEAEGLNERVFFTRKDSTWEYKDIKSLESVSLAVTDGYTYGKELDEYIKKNADDPQRIQFAKSDNALYEIIKKLQFSRVDVILENPNVAEHKFREVNFSDNVRVAGKLPHDEHYENLYIAFSPTRADAKDLAKILSDSMKRMRISGELQKILDKYNVTDWK